MAEYFTVEISLLATVACTYFMKRGRVHYYAKKVTKTINHNRTIIFLDSYTSKYKLQKKQIKQPATIV
jgi:hypothetical protein